MGLVSAMGYLVVKGDLCEWDSYATELLGLQQGQATQGGPNLYRMDDRAYRLAVYDGEPAVVAIGFEVQGNSELNGILEALPSKGYKAEEDAKLAAERKVRRLVRSIDPTGAQVEFFVGAEISPRPFVSPLGTTFVSGDMGMGHVFVFAPDADAMNDYYVETLGFRLSDTIDFDVTEGVFLHCNRRHHSLAYAVVPDVPVGVGHLMLETKTLDDVGYALDRAEDQGMVTLSIGKHTNDLMTSFYMRTPTGFEIEYGWDGRLVDDDTWVVGRHLAPSTWGHRQTTA